MVTRTHGGRGPKVSAGNVSGESPIDYLGYGNGSRGRYSKPKVTTAGVYLHPHPPGGRHSPTALPCLLEFCYPHQDSIGLQPHPSGEISSGPGTYEFSDPQKRDFMIGRTLSHYKILSEIDRGGMG